MLEGKNVVLGVTGSISAYKACDIVSRLRKAGASVNVIMTENAKKFVSPITFEALSSNAVVDDTFDRSRPEVVEHIALAKKADVILVAPASADIIGKISAGIADDMLTSTIVAATCPIVICPAMNTHMYTNRIVSDNMAMLRDYGFLFVEPDSGRLACGDTGKGKLRAPEEIVEYIENLLLSTSELKGKRVLITTGGTSEQIDRVRCITNHSTGKMGMALAREVVRRGGLVTLVVGNVTERVPVGVDKVVSVRSTEDMYHAVMDNMEDADYIIKSAAPSDYRVANYSDAKIKSDTLTLELVKNVDIAAAVGANKGNRKLVIFSAETDNLIEHAKAKLVKKNADLVVANNVTEKGAGFGVDTNIVSIITRDMRVLKQLICRDLQN